MSMLPCFGARTPPGPTTNAITTRPICIDTQDKLLGYDFIASRADFCISSPRRLTYVALAEYGRFVSLDVVDWVAWLPFFFWNTQPMPDVEVEFVVRTYFFYSAS